MDSCILQIEPMMENESKLTFLITETVWYTQYIHKFSEKILKDVYVCDLGKKKAKMGIG